MQIVITCILLDCVTCVMMDADNVMRLETVHIVLMGIIYLVMIMARWFVKVAYQGVGTVSPGMVSVWSVFLDFI